MSVAENDLQPSVFPPLPTPSPKQNKVLKTYGRKKAEETRQEHEKIANEEKHVSKFAMDERLRELMGIEDDWDIEGRNNNLNTWEMDLTQTSDEKDTDNTDEEDCLNDDEKEKTMPLPELSLRTDISDPKDTHVNAYINESSLSATLLSPSSASETPLPLSPISPKNHTNITPDYTSSDSGPMPTTKSKRALARFRRPYNTLGSWSDSEEENFSLAVMRKAFEAKGLHKALESEDDEEAAIETGQWKKLKNGKTLGRATNVSSSSKWNIKETSEENKEEPKSTELDGNSMSGTEEGKRILADIDINAQKKRKEKKNSSKMKLESQTARLVTAAETERLRRGEILAIEPRIVQKRSVASFLEKVALDSQVKTMSSDLATASQDKTISSDIAFTSQDKTMSLDLATASQNKTVSSNLATPFQDKTMSSDLTTISQDKIISSDPTTASQDEIMCSDLATTSQDKTMCLDPMTISADNKLQSKKSQKEGVKVNISTSEICFLSDDSDLELEMDSSVNNTHSKLSVMASTTKRNSLISSKINFFELIGSQRSPARKDIATQYQKPVVMSHAEMNTALQQKIAREMLERRKIAEEEAKAKGLWKSAEELMKEKVEEERDIWKAVEKMKKTDKKNEGEGEVAESDDEEYEPGQGSEEEVDEDGNVSDEEENCRSDEEEDNEQEEKKENEEKVFSGSASSENELEDEISQSENGSENEEEQIIHKRASKAHRKPQLFSDDEDQQAGEISKPKAVFPIFMRPPKKDPPKPSSSVIHTVLTETQFQNDESTSFFKPSIPTPVYQEGFHEVAQDSEDEIPDASAFFTSSFTGTNDINTTIDSDGDRSAWDKMRMHTTIPDDIFLYNSSYPVQSQLKNFSTAAFVGLALKPGEHSDFPVKSPSLSPDHEFDKRPQYVNKDGLLTQNKPKISPSQTSPGIIFGSPALSFIPFKSPLKRMSDDKDIGLELESVSTKRLKRLVRRVSTKRIDAEEAGYGTDGEDGDEEDEGEEDIDDDERSVGSEFESENEPENQCDSDEEDKALNMTELPVLQRSLIKSLSNKVEIDSKVKSTYIEEEAEESDDEFKGLGGADYEDDSMDTYEVDGLIVDNNDDTTNVDENALQIFARQQQLDKDAKLINRILKDVTTGSLLRRRRGNGLDDFDELDDDDDDNLVARRKREAAKRKRTEEDDLLDKIAENPKTKAFAESCQVVVDGEEHMFISDGEDKAVSVQETNEEKEDDNIEQRPEIYQSRTVAVLGDNTYVIEPEGEVKIPTNIRINDRTIMEVSSEQITDLTTTTIKHTLMNKSLFKSPGKLKRLCSMIEKGGIGQGNEVGRTGGFTTKKKPVSQPETHSLSMTQRKSFVQRKSPNPVEKTFRLLGLLEQKNGFE